MTKKQRCAVITGVTKEWIDKKPEIRTMTDVEASWLAAAIDGEGSIGLYQSTDGRTVHIQLFNTVEEFVIHAKKLIGCGTLHKRSEQKGRYGSKPVYSYHLKGMARCYAVLQQIKLYLIVKKAKANAILLELEEKPFGRWAAKTSEARLKQSERMKEIWKQRKSKKLQS